MKASKFSESQIAFVLRQGEEGTSFVLAKLGTRRASRERTRSFMAEVSCTKHGRQGIGLVCTHIAHAVESGDPVGFFWGDDTDTARPDAWCSDCERALRQIPNGATTAAWFKNCEFKVLCAACWDHAKSVLHNAQGSTLRGQSDRRDAIANDIVQILAHSQNHEEALTTLSAFIRELRAQGEPKETILARLQELRTSVSDEQEDILLEVMDFLVGWCSPQARIE